MSNRRWKERLCGCCCCIKGQVTKPATDDVEDIHSNHQEKAHQVDKSIEGAPVIRLENWGEPKSKTQQGWDNATDITLPISTLMLPLHCCHLYAIPIRV